MSRLIVLLDVDGVLADFLGGVRRVVAEVTDQPVPLRQTIYTDDLVGEVAAHWLRRSAEVAFCAGLEPYPGVPEAVEELRRVADVVAVTAPLKHCTGWEGVRRAWLAKHYGFAARDVVFTSRKDLVFGDVLVDDHFDHVEPWITRWAKNHPDVVSSPLVAPGVNPRHPLAVHWQREYNAHEQTRIAGLPHAARGRVVFGACWRRDVLELIA